MTATGRRGARLEIDAQRRRYAYRLFRATNAGSAPDTASHSPPYIAP